MPLSLCIDLSVDEQARLLDIARQSIVNGLDCGAALQLDVARLDANLRIDSAVFVTLTLGGDLRGCIGSLQPSAPLAQAVANAAFNAAFRDRRFTPVEADEIEKLQLEVSVLSSMELIAVDTAGLTRRFTAGGGWFVAGRPGSPRHVFTPGMGEDDFCRRVCWPIDVKSGSCRRILVEHDPLLSLSQHFFR